MNPRRTPVRIGTRGSTLAIWQTEWVRSRLRAAGYETERIEIKTTGDLSPAVPLAQIGSRALFTKQIDDALLEGRIDLAVHSFKDLPTQLPDGLSVAAVSVREDPSDALVGRRGASLDSIAEGGIVATSSLRRRAQLLHLRPDLSVVDVRGNVETRIGKLDREPAWAAILLATAGLVRLGLDHRIGERISPERMLPAPGQGALAVTVRSGDSPVAEAVRAAIHDEVTALAVGAERAFLRRLEGGCQVPIAAYAVMDRTGTRSSVKLKGRVLSLAGDRVIEGETREDAGNESQADAAGTRLAERLLQQGAGEILSDVRIAAAPVVPEP